MRRLKQSCYCLVKYKPRSIEHSLTLSTLALVPFKRETQSYTIYSLFGSSPIIGHSFTVFLCGRAAVPSETFSGIG